MSADMQERERLLRAMAELIDVPLDEVAALTSEYERARALADAERRALLGRIERRMPAVLAELERTVLHPTLAEHGLNPDDYRLEWS